MENNDNKVLVGIVVGLLAAVGTVAGTYFLLKTDTAKLVKRKYFDWVKINSKDEE